MQEDWGRVDNDDAWHSTGLSKVPELRTGTNSELPSSVTNEPQAHKADRNWSFFGVCLFLAPAPAAYGPQQPRWVRLAISRDSIFRGSVAEQES